MMRGLPCYCYTISNASKFHGLISLAFNRTVTAYVPTPPVPDACIRLTIQFDQNFLAELTGVVPEFYDTGMYLRSHDV
jgi:hypothetical protein